MKPIDMTMIQARRRALAEERERLLQAVQVLDAEAQELEIAERVFARLTLAGEVNLAGEGTLKADAQVISHGKPVGTPSMPEMIEEALAHSASFGALGLTPSGLLSYIQGKWWPAAKINNVGPIAWRMAQRGDLVKDKNGNYALAKERRQRRSYKKIDEEIEFRAGAAGSGPTNGGSLPST